MGRPQGPLEPRREARAGNAVRLTIDIGLQRAAERALRFGIQTAHANESYYANGGALVALDPRDGAVLAMASTPTFKPSVYVGRVDPKKIQPLLNDAAAKKANYPGINRVTSGEYPPGSTWKPVTALAAMQEHLLEPYQSLQCTPTATYGLDQQVFRNWDPYVNHADDAARGAGAVVRHVLLRARVPLLSRGRQGPDAHAAVGAEVRLRGPDRARHRRRRQSGLVPTPAWRKQTFSSDWDRAWNPGDSIQLAIGQKDVSVTPLQMARVLRDARERRQARDPVRRLAGREPRRPTGSRPSSSSASRPTRRSPSASTPPRCR